MWFRCDTSEFGIIEQAVVHSISTASLEEQFVIFRKKTTFNASAARSHAKKHGKVLKRIKAL